MTWLTNVIVHIAIPAALLCALAYVAVRGLEDGAR
jgi:hypothetical protein